MAEEAGYGDYRDTGAGETAPQDAPASAPDPEPAPAPKPIPVIGDRVWYYPAPAQTGMRSSDRNKPFAAFVVDVNPDASVNLVIFDHIGTPHATQSVAIVHPDAKGPLPDSYCELEAPKPVADEPTADETADGLGYDPVAGVTQGPADPAEATA